MAPTHHFARELDTKLSTAIILLYHLLNVRVMSTYAVQTH
jgi:hypothetical protein